MQPIPNPLLLCPLWEDNHMNLLAWRQEILLFQIVHSFTVQTFCAWPRLKQLQIFIPGFFWIIKFIGKSICVHDCLRHFKLLGNLVCVAAYPKSTPAFPVVRRQSHAPVSKKARIIHIQKCTFIFWYKLSVHDQGSSNFKFLFPAFSGY